MARPTKEEIRLFEERKRLMLLSISNGFTQAEVGRIFRIPRNTVSTTVRSIIKQKE